MLPIRTRWIFRSRWAALAWCAGIVWAAVGFVGDGQDPSQANDGAAIVHALG